MTEKAQSSGLAQPLVVACDESGNDGENLLAGSSPVFAHASVTVSSARAVEIMAEVRARTRSASAELKSKTLLHPKNEGTARWLLEHRDLEDSVSLHLTNKRYFLVTKLFDTTIEELASANGYDMYADGSALCGANVLFFTAPAFYGQRWNALLVAYQDFLRAKSASDAHASLATLEARVLDSLSLQDASANIFLDLIHAGIKHLQLLSRLQLGQGIDHRLRTLDPLIPAVGAAVAYWAEQSGRSVEILHDTAKELTPERVATMRRYLAEPEIAAPHRVGKGVKLAGVTLVDSKREERVQLADLLAGLGRSVIEAESDGRPHPLTALVERHMSRLSILPRVELMNPEAAKAVALGA
ncbi:DUF3800 domain-containing protein [Microbacterium gubbeenense]|uniref:DUF3800 domain-containing protein n=1 Tax=Microbacterium gubbeenense TaxID=159896 RepID=UPI00146E4AC6|nr:DUF3800 domain-containing protein [Microbacterium gubbeenense]